MSDRPFRVLPKVTPSNEHYWTGGAEGELRILRCDDCRYWVHPPAPVCGSCLGRALTPEAVSGRGTVHSCTLNHQEWNPTMTHPYAIVLVDLPEQDGLRILTNLVDCPPEDAAIGMDVEVCFEAYDEVWLPMFRPPARPAPEDKPARPAPEDKPARPAPEDKPARPAPEDKPALPAPEDKALS